MSELCIVDATEKLCTILTSSMLELSKTVHILAAAVAVKMY